MLSSAQNKKLIEDLKAISPSYIVTIGGLPVPLYQKQGYLEKLGHSRHSWYTRFYVLRDSFLLCYDLKRSDHTVEPRAAISLGNASIQLVSLYNRPFCLLIITVQCDRFLLSAPTDVDRQSWMEALAHASALTYPKLREIAAENRKLALVAGVTEILKTHTSGPTYLFDNDESGSGGSFPTHKEGWLLSRGFNPEEQATIITIELTRTQRVLT